MLTHLLMLLALSGANATSQGLDQTRLTSLNAGIQQVYDAVIRKDGSVDYPLLKKREDLQAHLDAFAAYVATVDPNSVTDKNEKIAFFSNTYNVLTLKGVNDAWPVPSVRKIHIAFGFFTRNLWEVGGQKVSLNDIEKKYLRDLDPRIHFIINCASESCPILQNRVLTAKNVEQVMDDATLAFLNDQGKNRFNGNDWKLSKIFEWYQDDWGKKDDVIAFIRQYRKDLKNPEKIKYFEYNWDLNGPQG